LVEYKVLAIKDFLTTEVGSYIFPQNMDIIFACRYA